MEVREKKNGGKKVGDLLKIEGRPAESWKGIREGGGKGQRKY